MTLPRFVLTWLAIIAFCLAFWAIVLYEAHNALAAPRCHTTRCLERAITWQRGENQKLRRQLAVRYHRDASYAIHLASAAFGVSEKNMRTIAQCESGMGAQVTAEAGSGASGLFQFLPSTFSHTPFGHGGFDIFDPVVSALAAAQIVVHDRGWHQWSCSSITGVR